MLAAIDKMLLQTEDKVKEERIIRSGYVCALPIDPCLSHVTFYLLHGRWSVLKTIRPNKVGLVEYLASLKRIDRAVAEMSAKKMRVNQQAIGDYSELLSEGSTQLQNRFRAILSEDLQPIEPLHYITKREITLVRQATLLTQNRTFLPVDTR